MRYPLTALAVSVLTLPASYGAAVVVSDTNIAAALTTFRAGIGGGANNANALGTQLSGHREINWDAAIVPVLPALLPGGFFNSPPTTRGLVMTTPGTGLMLSATDFAEVDASYGAEFNSFSPSKIISPQGSVITDVTFRVPGAATPAFVNGFGVVFSDVDTAGGTTLEYFGPGGLSMGIFSAPVNSGAFSFLGVFFDAGERVTGVRITSGTAALGAGVLDVSSGGAGDVVAMDDFLYSEPAAIPEPATWTLFGGALLAIGLLRRGR